MEAHADYGHEGGEYGDEEGDEEDHDMPEEHDGQWYKFFNIKIL